MAYNMTAFEDSRNIADSFAAVNTASGNVLVNLGLITLWIIIFFQLLKNNPVPESLVAASGTLTFVSLILLAAELTSLEWVIGFTLLFALTTVGVYLRNKTS